MSGHALGHARPDGAVRPERRHRGHGADASRAGAVARVIRLVLVDAAAVLGALCIAATLAAALFHVSLIMFRTGSMAPTMPTGALAVVRQIPASAARVGDVVTVDRPGELPITHRVVSIVPGEAPGDTTQLTLRGDANSVPDPVPYRVDTVRRVIWAAPGLAYFVAWLGRPPVLVGIALLVGALVSWALWPHSAVPRRRRP